MEFRQIAILVEGQTEAAFVHEILAPYLQSFGAYVTPVIVKTARLADGTSFKGGGMVWKHYERDLRKLLAASHYVIRDAELQVVIDRCPGLESWVGQLLDR